MKTEQIKLVYMKTQRIKILECLKIIHANNKALKRLKDYTQFKSRNDQHFMYIHVKTPVTGARGREGKE